MNSISDCGIQLPMDLNEHSSSTLPSPHETSRTISFIFSRKGRRRCWERYMRKDDRRQPYHLNPLSKCKNGCNPNTQIRWSMKRLFLSQFILYVQQCRVISWFPTLTETCIRIMQASCSSASVWLLLCFYTLPFAYAFECRMGRASPKCRRVLATKRWSFPWTIGR